MAELFPLAESLDLFHCQQWFSRYPGYAIAVAEASQALAVAAELRRALLLRLTGGLA